MSCVARTSYGEHALLFTVLYREAQDCALCECLFYEAKSVDCMKAKQYSLANVSRVIMSQVMGHTVIHNVHVNFTELSF